MCEKKVKWVCAECGETSIYWEATIYWDVEAQDWAIGGGLSDDATTFCDDCGAVDAGKEVSC